MTKEQDQVKHTPGPWRFDGLYSIVSDSGESVAHDLDVSPNCEANACLIAAAPELLGALKGSLNSFKCTQKPEHYPEGHWCNRAISAIAKAEGLK